jgi:predicted metal-dependent HD superfamily phosphohydrolase
MTIITIDPTKSSAAKLAAVQAQAKQRLADTDWSQVADVAAVLTNKADFDTYRAAVRALYFNPVANPTWPQRPEAVWSGT